MGTCVEMAWIKFGFGSALGRPFPRWTHNPLCLVSSGFAFSSSRDEVRCVVSPPRCSSVVWFVRVNGRMDFVRLPVACGDIGCGRLICSSRDALLEDEIFQIIFEFDGLLGDMRSHATIGILKYRGNERPYERCHMALVAFGYRFVDVYPCVPKSLCCMARQALKVC